MSDFESFGGFDAGREEIDPAAFEKFKERMRAAAAQLAALQKQEQKQKKSEDELVKILQKFIKSGKNKEILLLVLRLLEMNVPAGFIVSLLIISNPEIQEQLGIKLLAAAPPAPSNNATGKPQDQDTNPSPNLPDIYIGGEILPLKIKIAIVTWVNEIAKKIDDQPSRCLKTLISPDGQPQLSAIQLGTFCLRDFLSIQNSAHKYAELKDFVTFILADLLQKTAEELKNRKELE